MKQALRILTVLVVALSASLISAQEAAGKLKGRMSATRSTFLWSLRIRMTKER